MNGEDNKIRMSTVDEMARPLNVSCPALHLCAVSNDDTGHAPNYRYRNFGPCYRLNRRIRGSAKRGAGSPAAWKLKIEGEAIRSSRSPSNDKR